MTMTTSRTTPAIQSPVRRIPAAAGVKECGCPEYDATMSRRSFLKRAGAAGLVAGIASETMFTRLAFGATPYSGDVLIVLSLRGGFDGLNVLVPWGDPDYLGWRPNVGIPESALLKVDGMFGFHPQMAPLMPFWTAKTFGAIQAVGMEQPNRSHFAAMEEMERAAPGTSLRTGWLDRVLGLRDTGTPFQAVQMRASLPASMFTGPRPELAMWSVDDFGLDAAWDAGERARWNTALQAMIEGAPAAIGDPAATALGALATAANLKDAGYVPAAGALYPDTDLGNGLKDIARLIKSDVGLQVAAIDYGDWDMHSGMGTVGEGWMYDHLGEFAASLAAFGTDLGAKLNDVTLVTLTEFGRRVEENGSGGVDHGYGQAVLLLGGGVKGGQVHGTWPGLAPGDLIDGDLAMTTDYRTVIADALEKRCGAGSLTDVFPGLPGARPGAFSQRT
jgi:uncharacterized protein (DUF1501 family)